MLLKAGRTDKTKQKFHPLLKLGDKKKKELFESSARSEKQVEGLTVLPPTTETSGEMTLEHVDLAVLLENVIVKLKSCRSSKHHNNERNINKFIWSHCKKIKE